MRILRKLLGKKETPEPAPQLTQWETTAKNLLSGEILIRFRQLSDPSIKILLEDFDAWIAGTYPKHQHDMRFRALLACAFFAAWEAGFWDVHSGNELDAPIARCVSRAYDGGWRAGAVRAEMWIG